MGMVKFRPPGAPKPLNGFRWNLEYITKSGVWPHMQIHMALRQRGWSRRTHDLWLITCFGFLVYLFMVARCNRADHYIFALWFLSSCSFFPPLPSNRHHRSSGDCLEGKRENYRVCSVQYCVQQLCTMQCTHTYDQTNSSLDWVLSHWAHFTVLRFIFVLCITVCCMHA